MQAGNTPNKHPESEYEGQTTEEAIQKAEKSLGVDREQMKIKVVCEEKKGLFGMRGSKLAKIKAVKKSTPKGTADVPREKDSNK